MMETRTTDNIAAAKSRLELDSLGPYEFWSEHRNHSLQQPELMLMKAVLEDAVSCYFDYAHPKTRCQLQLFKDAESWFFSRDAKELFSFENVSGFLGINGDYMRRGLLLFKETCQSADGFTSRSRTRF